MTQNKLKLILAVLFLASIFQLSAQEESKLKLSGELLTDQRFLLESPNDWAWNENRLTRKLDKRITGNCFTK